MRNAADVAQVLSSSRLLGRCLDDVGDLGVWIGAGAVAQTVWNVVHGFDDGFGIRDVDVVYFDPDPSEVAELRMCREVARRLRGCPWRVDVKNQARVHEWYPRRFGHVVSPHTSVEDALATWPTTATAIAVRRGSPDVEVLAPFGVRDLSRLVVRANRVRAPREVFEAKVARWITLWPRLTVLPWASGVGCPPRPPPGLTPRHVPPPPPGLTPPSVSGR